MLQQVFRVRELLSFLLCCESRLFPFGMPLNWNMFQWIMVKFLFCFLSINTVLV